MKATFVFRALRSGGIATALLGSVFMVSSCGDANDEVVEAEKLGGSCFINSDCKKPLKCAFKRCHNECKTSDDCPSDERCVPSDRPFNVCLFKDETNCIYHTDCPAEHLICGTDNRCREQCKSVRDCLGGQVCIEGTCADEKELVDGKLPPADEPGLQDPEGKSCQYTTDCDAPLVCKVGFCLAECKGDRDCDAGKTCDATGTCVAGSATTPNCANGQQDPGETAVDCGGPCGGCPDTSCTRPSDCASYVCEKQKCQAPQCGDMIQNGTESDTDCGGDCPSCGPLMGCWTNADCTTNSCDAGLCTLKSCGDKQKGELETDVDCGGGDCPKCDDGKACAINGDCKSDNCVNKTCAPPGPVAWTIEFDGSWDGSPIVRSDSSGDLLIASELQGVVDFGDGEKLTGGVNGDLFLAKRKPSGAKVGTSLLLTGMTGSSDALIGLTVDPAGDAIIAATTQPGGIFSSTSCGGVLTGKGVRVVAKFSGQSLKWAECVTAGLDLGAIAADSVGDVWVAGKFSFDATLGGHLMQTGNPSVPFVAKLSGATGKTVWAQVATSAGVNKAQITSLVADGTDVYASGQVGVASGFSIGAGTKAAVVAANSNDVFVFKMAGDGSVVGAPRTFGGTLFDQTTGMALNGSTLVLAGHFQNQVDFGDVVRSSKGMKDGFLVRVSTSDLSTVWSKSFGNTGDDEARGVAVAANGEIAVTGFVTGAVDFGGGTKAYNASKDIFLARYSSSGLHQFSSTWGGFNSDEGSSVAFSGASLALAGKRGSGKFDFGAGPLLTAVTGPDAAFVTLFP